MNPIPTLLSQIVLIAVLALSPLSKEKTVERLSLAEKMYAFESILTIEEASSTSISSSASISDIKAFMVRLGVETEDEKQVLEFHRKMIVEYFDYTYKVGSRAWLARTYAEVVGNGSTYSDLDNIPYGGGTTVTSSQRSKTFTSAPSNPSGTAYVTDGNGNYLRNITNTNFQSCGSDPLRIQSTASFTPSSSHAQADVDSECLND